MAGVKTRRRQDDEIAAGLVGVARDLSGTVAIADLDLRAQPPAIQEVSLGLKVLSGLAFDALEEVLFVGSVQAGDFLDDVEERDGAVATPRQVGRLAERGMMLVGQVDRNQDLAKHGEVPLG